MSVRFRISSSIVCSMFALSSSPSACIPPVPSRTRNEEASASSTMLVAVPSAPTSSVADQAVTWIRRLCPAFAAAPVRPVFTDRVALPGPNLCVPGGIGMRRSLEHPVCSRAPTRSKMLVVPIPCSVSHDEELASHGRRA